MLLHQPTDVEVRNFLAAQRELPFSYAEVGATRDALPPVGYPVNYYKGRLGAGRETFERAVDALRSWRMYNLGWTRLCWPEAPVREGAVVAILARHFALWSLNACRIVYTLEEDEGDSRRTGFAFGTLPGHVEQGEERFTIEMEGESGEVSYELFAFARPRPLLAKIGYPIVRALQRRFAADSFRAMRRAANRSEQ